MNNPEIDFKAVFGDGLYNQYDLSGDAPKCFVIPCAGNFPEPAEAPEPVPCVPPSCPSFQEFRIEPEPDWQELVNQSWRNHPALRNTPDGFYPETVRRQQVQGIVQIAQEFRKVRGLAPDALVLIMPPEGMVKEMLPLLNDLYRHRIGVMYDD